MKALENFGNVSILSVEDDSFNQELAAAIFEDIPNVNVFRANNGKEAIKIVEEVMVDVILLDLMMPEMNGFETLKYLKETKEYKSIPVIIVTSEENEKKSTYKLGANDFISKPYNPEELKLRVFNHLRIKKFTDLMKTIRDESSSEEAVSENHLCHLKEALEIADNSQKQLLEKLGNMAHENGNSDENASKRVGEYARLLAKINGLNAKEIDNIYYVMAIYDIGLLRIPKNKLDNDNTINFRTHPELGLNVLNDLEETILIKMAKDVTISHHENWDGSGYPNGLKGDDIPLYARIASIVDYYDELTVSRVYSTEVLSSQDALDIIKREKGVKFDPTLLNLFVENFELFREIKNRLT